MLSFDQVFYTACLIFMAMDFLQKTPFSFIYHFDINLVNSFSRRTVQNPNTSDEGKNQGQI